MTSMKDFCLLNGPVLKTQFEAITGLSVVAIDQVKFRLMCKAPAAAYKGGAGWTVILHDCSNPSIKLSPSRDWVRGDYTEVPENMNLWIYLRVFTKVRVTAYKGGLASVLLNDETGEIRLMSGTCVVKLFPPAGAKANVAYKDESWTQRQKWYIKLSRREGNQHWNTKATGEKADIKVWMGLLDKMVQALPTNANRLFRAVLNSTSLVRRADGSLDSNVLEEMRQICMRTQGVITTNSNRKEVSND